MRTPDEIQKDLDIAICNHNSAESMIKMMKKGSPRDFIEAERKKLKPLHDKVDQLKAELAACHSQQ